MRDWGDPMEMRAMLDAGLTKKAAAKRLGVDRRTLSRWQAEAAPAAKRRKPRIHKLDPYKAIIQERLRG